MGSGGDCDQVVECLRGELKRGTRRQRPSEMSEEPKGWNPSSRKRKRSRERETRLQKTARALKRRSDHGLDSIRLQDDFLSHLFIDQVCTVGHLEALANIVTEVMVGRGISVISLIKT